MVAGSGGPIRMAEPLVHLGRLLVAHDRQRMGGQLPAFGRPSPLTGDPRQPPPPARSSASGCWPLWITCTPRSLPMTRSDHSWKGSTGAGVTGGVGRPDGAEELRAFDAGVERPVWLCLGILPDLHGDPGAWIGKLPAWLPAQGQSL